MTPRTRGRVAGHLWASTASPVELLRLENAVSETPAEDFAAAVDRAAMDEVEYAAGFLEGANGEEA